MIQTQVHDQSQYTGCNLPIDIAKTCAKKTIGPHIKTIEPISSGANVTLQEQMYRCHNYGVPNMLSGSHGLGHNYIINGQKGAVAPVQVVSIQTLKNLHSVNASVLDSHNVNIGLGAIEAPNTMRSEVRSQNIGHNMCMSDNSALSNYNVLSLTAQQNNSGGNTVGLPRAYSTCSNQQDKQVSQPGMILATATMMGQQKATNDQVIQSLQALRQSSHVNVNERVQQRYRELEEATGAANQGNIDLLLEVLSRKQKQNKSKVKWPQDLAFIGSMRKRQSSDQLMTCQWLSGFLRIRQEESDHNIKENMIDYVTELLQDACDYSWDSAKEAHAVLLHRMAGGIVDWTQLKEVYKIRKRYSQTTSTNQVQEKGNKAPRVVPCLKFNKGACIRSGDHEWKDLMLKHMCQYCFATYGKVEQHACKDCWKAPKEQ